MKINTDPNPTGIQRTNSIIQDYKDLEIEKKLIRKMLEEFLSGHDHNTFIIEKLRSPDAKGHIRTRFVSRVR